MSPALVGREGELSRLVAAVGDSPSVVVVEGEAGIGKSRLIAELLSHPNIGSNRREPAGHVDVAPGRGWQQRRVLLGRAQGIRESFPLGPVIEALRELDRDIDLAPLSPVAGALRPLLPELAERLPPLSEPLDDRGAERHRMFRGLVEVLDIVGPAVLVLEDLHWADVLTTDFVGYLFGSLPPGLSVVCTFRGEEVRPALRAATGRLVPGVARVEVGLEPFGPQETGELAAAILEEDRVSDSFAQYLCERTAGLPFAIEEVLALLRDRYSVVRYGGRWARRTLDELDVPAGIRDQLLGRLDRLSDDARAVVEAAAVLQSPVAVPVLLATVGTLEARALAGMEEALGAGILTEHGRLLGLRHALAAQALYEALPAPRRHDLHSRVADQLASLQPAPLGQVAHHFHQAGRMAEWIDAAEQAADHALSLHHDDEAIRLLEGVLRRAPLRSEQRGRIAVKLGSAAVQLPGGSELINLLSEVLDDELPRTLRGELRFLISVLLDERRSDPDRQRSLATAAVHDLAERPAVQAQAMACLGIPMGTETPLSEHLTWLHRSLEIVPHIEDAGKALSVLGTVAMVLVHVGDPAWRAVAADIGARAGDSSAERQAADACRRLGVGACFAGHGRQAEELLAHALEGATRSASPKLILCARSARACLDYFRGEWNGLPDIVAGLEGELADWPTVRVDAQAVAGCLALARGDLDEAAKRLDEVLAQADSVGFGTSQHALATPAVVRLALSRGDVEHAALVSDRALSAFAVGPICAGDARAVPALTRAFLAAGRLDDASSVIAAAERDLGGIDAPLAAAVLAGSRGHLSSAAGRYADAASHFALAAEAHDRLPCPYEAAQAREHAARALFAAGNGTAVGARALRAALETYQRLGATWDRSRAAQLAREHGVPVPAPHRRGRRGYGDQLTPREQQVVELAAQGFKNQEIADELFVSVRTVEQHMTAGMRKLGVRSRAAIAQQLPKAPGVAPLSSGVAAQKQWSLAPGPHRNRGFPG